MNLLEEAKIDVLYRGDTGLGATNIDCTAMVDMSGYDSVMLMCSVVENTANVSTGGFELVPRHSAVVTSTTGLTDLGSTAIAGTGTALDTGDIGKIAVVDIWRPTKRYVGASLDKDGTAQCQAGPIIAIRYNPSVAPTTSGSDILEAVNLTAPTT